MRKTKKKPWQPLDRDPGPMELCRIRDEVRDEYVPAYLDRSLTYLCLGTVKGMPGHSVFVEVLRNGEGRVFTGLHTDTFRVLREEEI